MKSAIFTKPLPLLGLLIAHLIWGGNFLVAKVTLEEFPVMSLAFLRFALALLLIIPFFLLDRKKYSVKFKDLPRLFLIGVTMVTLNIALFYEGIIRTNITSASVLTLVIPIISVLLGWTILKEKVYTINLAGIGSGFLGAIIIIGTPLIFTQTLESKVFLGNVLIILASISWVLGMIVSREMLKKYSSQVVTAMAFLTGAVTFMFPALNEYLLDPTWPTTITGLGILGLLYITILSSISAYFLLEWAISYIPISKANLLQYIEPLFATTLAVIILKESITLPFIIGAILIGLGVYWGTLGKEDHHKRHKAHRM